MASQAISWVPGAHVRFGDLDFIITVGGELALAHVAIQSLPPSTSPMGGLSAIPVSPSDPSHLGRTRAASPYLWKTPHVAP
jgi:hypothetical protein